jgi:hypothetical protein
MAILAPSFAIAMAAALPIPLLPPVMSATLSLSFMMLPLHVGVRESDWDDLPFTFRRCL